MVLHALANVDPPVIVQLSSYDANGGNTRDRVIARYDPIRAATGFDLSSVVLVPNNGHRDDMMSMIFARGLNNDQWVDQLKNLPDRFADWLRRV